MKVMEKLAAKPEETENEDVLETKKLPIPS